HPAASATILRTSDGRQYVRLVRDHRWHAAVFVEVTDLDRVAFLELTRSIDQISMAAQEGLANASERRGRRAPAEWTRTASRRSSPSRKTELVPKARPTSAGTRAQAFCNRHAKDTRAQVAAEAM